MDESKRSFAIIRHNFETFEGCDVVQVVRVGDAEITVGTWDAKLTREEKAAGWLHFLEPTSLKPGTDSKFATEVTELKRAVRRARHRNAKAFALISRSNETNIWQAENRLGRGIR